MQIAKLMGGMWQIKCPRCGAKLNQTQLKNSRVNRCSKGCGIWVDQQQLDQLAGSNPKRYEVTSDLPPRKWIRGEPV